MNEAPFRAIGGAVVADHGLIPLPEARALVAAYAREAETSDGRWRSLCAARVRNLAIAAAEATDWRRAAGWADPDDGER